MKPPKFLLFMAALSLASTVSAFAQDGPGPTEPAYPIRTEVTLVIFPPAGPFRPKPF